MSTLLTPAGTKIKCKLLDTFTCSAKQKRGDRGNFHKIQPRRQMNNTNTGDAFRAISVSMTIHTTTNLQFLVIKTIQTKVQLLSSRNEKKRVYTSSIFFTLVS